MLVSLVVSIGVPGGDGYKKRANSFGQNDKYS